MQPLSAEASSRTVVDVLLTSLSPPWLHRVVASRRKKTTISETQGSQVWAGSVEIELHYIPEGQSGGVQVDSTRGGRLFGGADGNSSSGSGSGSGRDNRDGSCGSGNGYPPLSPCSTSLASSFVKAAKSLPKKARASGAAAAASAAVVQADLLALSPRTARGAETAAAAGRKYAGRGGGGGGGGDDTEKGARGHAGGKAASGGGGGGGGGGNCKSFLSGVLCTMVLVLGVLWALGDPLLMSGQFGLGLTVLEDGGAGRQAVVLIHGSVSRERVVYRYEGTLQPQS